MGKMKDLQIQQMNEEATPCKCGGVATTVIPDFIQGPNGTILLIHLPACRACFELSKAGRDA